MHIDKRFAFLLMASMVILGIFVSSTETAFAQAPVVSVGTVSGNAGTAVDVTVSFTAGGTGVSTLQFDLTFPASLAYVSTATGAAATAAGKSASGNALSGGARVLVFSLGTTSIGSGVVAIVRLNIAGGTSPGSIPVGITGIVAADAASNAVTTSGSGGSVTVTAPGDTTAPVISAVTASGMSATGATISWTTNEASDTQVDYGTTTAYGSSTTLKDTSPRVSSHSQALSGLQASTLYHYRVKSKDAAGNLATSGDFTFTTTAAPDTTAPVISAVTASGMSATGATVSWTTNEASDTQVDFGTTTAYGSSTTLKDTSPRVSSHSQALSGLQASTLYHYRVKSKDAAGNLATSGDFTFTTTAAPDTTAPVISAVTASGMSATGATISWTTNEASDTQVDFGTTTAYGSSTTLKDTSPRVSSHSQALSGLQASTLYHYRVKSKDAAGNLATSGDFTFTTTAAPDTTAPVISAVTASGMSATGATISWTTNEASDTQVDYGTTTAYGSSTTLKDTSPRVSSHSQALSGLQASTLYHYRVKSKDAAGNLATSGDFTFTTTAAPDTTAPVISAVTASGMSATGATVSWTTNEASDTQVDFGTTTAYGSSTTLKDTSPRVSSHSQALSGLQASTLYHYRVKSKDAAGNLATSGDFTFTTTAAPDTTAPVISAVTASGMSATGATVSWTTNEASDTQVEYGTTTAYGSLTTLNGSMVTGHSQGLSGLTASTTYNYRVRSKDAAGNQAVSGNFTFATTTAPDTTAPVISAVTASGMSATGATVSWTTNEAADTQVEYGTTTAYGSLTTLNGSMVTGHLQGLSGLTASTTYNYRVRSKDAAGNQAVSGNATFTTTAAPDTTAPVISAVTASGMSATGATISWTTNEAADTQVEYGTTTAYGSLTTLNGSMVTGHSQGLSGLTASTQYHYRVKSKDAAGNLATSGDFTFTTTATADTTAPVISAIQVTNITTSTVDISWTTNEASDTQVEYGLTATYGSSTTINTAQLTSHLLSLSGLSPDTLYHYRVKSKDAADNLATSGDLTFTTSSVLPPPTNVSVK